VTLSHFQRSALIRESQAQIRKTVEMNNFLPFSINLAANVNVTCRVLQFGEFEYKMQAH